MVSIRGVADAALILALLADPLAGCRDGGPLEEAEPGRPDLLVFVLDAARADHFGCYGYARDTTPHIDAFAASATRYRQAVSDAAFTFASVAALLSGQPPGRSGLVAPQRLGDGLALLAEVARSAGYRTVAYSENPWVSGTLGFGRGVERFSEAFPLEAALRSPHEPPPLDSAAGIRSVLDFIARDDERPFFAYVHLLRPHNPYAPPPGFSGRFGSTPESDGSTATLLAIDAGARHADPAEIAGIVSLYDENLAYGDALFGELQRGLGALGRLDRTVIVVLSDHGEAFLEHGRMLHNSTAFDEMIRVPLLVRVPGGSGRVSDDPVQLSDVGAALERLLSEPGLPPSALTRLRRPGSAPTVSWTLPRDGLVGIRTPRRKLVLEAAGLAPVGFYDLERDPAERAPLAPDGSAEPLLAAAREHVRPRAAAPALELDGGTRRRLEELGYLRD